MPIIETLKHRDAVRAGDLIMAERLRAIAPKRCSRPAPSLILETVVAEATIKRRFFGSPLHPERSGGRVSAVRVAGLATGPGETLPRRPGRPSRSTPSEGTLPARGSKHDRGRQ